jgi:hypothetical protein
MVATGGGKRERRIEKRGDTGEEGGREGGRMSRRIEIFYFHFLPG